MGMPDLLRTGLFGALLCTAISAGAQTTEEPVKQFDADKKLQGDCVGCHINVTPGIVRQHLDSPHANASNPNDEVLCSDCHGDQHVTMEDWRESTMPTAETCGECHKEQAREHRQGKHELGWLVMKSQIAWHGQPGAITQEGYRGCSGCHKIGKKGLRGVTDGNTGKVTYDGGKGRHTTATETRSVMPAIPGTVSRSRRDAIHAHVPTVTWASTTRSGRCTPRPSMA